MVLLIYKIPSVTGMFPKVMGHFYPFQEVSQWIDSAEAKLLESRKSEERALGREIEEWRPKVGNLRNMAEKLVQIFVGQKNDVVPEMEMLGQR